VAEYLIGPMENGKENKDLYTVLGFTGIILQAPGVSVCPRAVASVIVIRWSCKNETPLSQRYNPKPDLMPPTTL